MRIFFFEICLKVLHCIVENLDKMKNFTLGKFYLIIYEFKYGNGSYDTL